MIKPIKITKTIAIFGGEYCWCYCTINKHVSILQQIHGNFAFNLQYARGGMPMKNIEQCENYCATQGLVMKACLDHFPTQ